MFETEGTNVQSEIRRRRTFAIISHPDAGKTTMTEKLLLYGDAIHIAGSIKQRKAERSTTSDWMALEQQRGISVSTSVLQFDYRGLRLNLLDTPGHNDFSEDTYRTLAAVDCALMLIDRVKGVEPQTIKLFQVCRMRGIPIVTFVNKMDRNGFTPIEVLDEVERVLGIPCCPMNWPVGSGTSFQGVYDRQKQQVLRFKRVEGGSRRVPMQTTDLKDPELVKAIGEGTAASLADELELMDGVTDPFDQDAFLDGKVTPVFFGSALSNFGVEPFLDGFLDIAPAPRPRQTNIGMLEPDVDSFTAFVFKVQANMDPHHRDRIAFARICSGTYRRDLMVTHTRTGKQISLAKAMIFMAQERIQIKEAYSGDVVGLWDPGILRIGDTLCEGTPLAFEGIPQFSPEHFRRIGRIDSSRRKQLWKGLEQLSQEGAIQLFFEKGGITHLPIIGAVGVLQFDVAQYRLKAEYGADVVLEPLPFHFARWLEGDTEAEHLQFLDETALLLDIEDRPVILFKTEWMMNLVQEKCPNTRFLAAVQPGRRERGLKMA